ncbi:hypothetical protein BDN70DRAFT_531187 [Pholiota conissans]|uniref:Uncharacterized protein n=1 Tax=Pholiota conissans TaxID=109636 RepID=A0A9P5YNF7_9AGAR|nr:hypothetical protein BDN70DRAFT_531187 [Pholiota conissans]
MTVNPTTTASETQEERRNTGLSGWALFERFNAGWGHIGPSQKKLTPNAYVRFARTALLSFNLLSSMYIQAMIDDPHHRRPPPTIPLRALHPHPTPVALTVLPDAAGLDVVNKEKEVITCQQTHRRRR